MTEPYAVIRMRPLKPESEWPPDEPEPRRLTRRQSLALAAIVISVQVMLVVIASTT